MKKFLMSLCAALLVFGVVVQDAEARRLGGGMSRGMQRESVTQRQAAPAAPTQQAAPQAWPQSPTLLPQKRSWLGPIAGLAAGLGLGALLSHFGFGDELGSFLLIALLAMAAIFVFKLLARRPGAPAREPLRYAGMGQPLASEPEQFGPAGTQGFAPAATAIPADFDTAGFLRVAKVNFLRLQAANDAGNLEDLREFTTPEMFAEAKLDVDERRGAAQQTDVVSLEADLLEVVTEGSRHVASVRFHGMIREEKDGAAGPFDEVWNLVKPADGSRGWLVAGIQQLN